jgi:hypothetical protein
LARLLIFFDKAGVAVIELEGILKVGDEIQIKGATTDFEQKVDSIQVEHKNIESAKKGDAVGLKVKEKVRLNDLVFVVDEEEIRKFYILIFYLCLMNLCQHYISLQKEWIETHRYFMGIEERRNVDSIEAVCDFQGGNDKEFWGGCPSENFNHHLSTRGLTWRQEFNIYFYNNFLKELNLGKLSKEDKVFVGSKLRELNDESLLEFEPLESKV